MRSIPNDLLGGMYAIRLYQNHFDYSFNDIDFKNVFLLNMETSQDILKISYTDIILEHILGLPWENRFNP